MLKHSNMNVFIPQMLKPPCGNCFQVCHSKASVCNAMLSSLLHLSLLLSSFKFCFNQTDKFRNKFGMINLKKCAAFTLTELLLALTIVGVLAVLTVPILMNNIHNRTFAAQVKNMAATIEQLAQDELIDKGARDLSDTDFSSPAKLLSDKHFAIVKKCATGTDAKLNCWKITAEGKDKVTYKNLNKSAASPESLISVVLKNGVLIGYKVSSNVTAKAKGMYGAFYMDINSNDKPNIGGRDFFQFYIDSKGHVQGGAENQTDTVYTLEQKITKCKKSFSWCFGVLAENGWKMDY